MVKLDIKQVSETHFMIYEQNEISPEIRNKISTIALHIESLQHPAVISVTSSYRSIMVAFDVKHYTYETVLDELDLHHLNLNQENASRSKIDNITSCIWW